MAGLPKFTKFQQDMVIIHLIKMIPHREIARHLQNRFSDQQFLREWGEDPADYEGWVPEGMSQQEYEQIVIKRCKDYVSNKDRKPYQVIKDGREKYKKQVLEYVKQTAGGIAVDLSLPLNIYESTLTIEQAMKIVDLTWQIRSIMDGEEEDLPPEQVDRSIEQENDTPKKEDPLYAENMIEV